MDDKSSDFLIAPEWFGNKKTQIQNNVLFVTVAKAIVGAIIGSAFFLVGHTKFAIIVWGITAVVGLISVSSEKGRTGITCFFAFLGEWIGRILTYAILVPIYFLFIPARIYNRLIASDPLHLRDDDSHTFWQECDRDERKRRHIGSMFATEKPAVGKRTVAAIISILIVMVIGAEICLRVLGVGNPIVYVDDPVVGYYPAPNQNVSRYGNTVSTNLFGMRAPNYAAKKPKGNFRILMIGDSTLWGGSYMGQDDIYARLLEKSLNAKFAKGKIEVLNIGVNGWGPFHKLGYIEKFGTFDADIAVICLPLGDVYRPMYSLTHVPFFSANTPPRLALEEVFLKLVWQYRTRQIGPPVDESQQIQAKRGIEAYRQLAVRLEQSGCEVFVEALPGRELGISGIISPQSKELFNQFSQSLEAESFRVGFPVGFAGGQKERNEDLYHDGCHLDWRGHQLYAEYLKDRISHQSAKLKAWGVDHSREVEVTKAGGDL